MLEQSNSGLASVTEEVQAPASEPRPPTLRRGMAGSGLPSTTSTGSPRGTPRTPRGSLRRDPSTRRPGTMGESDTKDRAHRLQRQGRSLDSAFLEANRGLQGAAQQTTLGSAQASLPSLMLVMLVLALLQRWLVPLSGVV